MQQKKNYAIQKGYTSISNIDIDIEKPKIYIIPNLIKCKSWKISDIFEATKLIQVQTCIKINSIQKWKYYPKY